MHFSTWLSDIVFLLVTFLATNFVCNQYNFFLMDFMVWDSYFVFNPRSKIYVEVYDGIVLILNLETLSSSSAASQIQWWVPAVLFFF